LSTDATWFATASEAVDWFRWRRSIRFNVEAGSPGVKVEAPPLPPHLPAASILTRHAADTATGDAVETRYAGGAQPVWL
jgi:hypothetical protein